MYYATLWAYDIVEIPDWDFSTIDHAFLLYVYHFNDPTPPPPCCRSRDLISICHVAYHFYWDNPYSFRLMLYDDVGSIIIT
jgi:hypothetical protein